MVIIVIIGISSFNPAAKSNSSHDMVKTSLNIPFKLNIGQAAVIETENLNIKFINVTEDSRCPSDVQCIWEGQAIVQISISKDNQNINTFNLTERAGHDELSILSLNGYSINLKKVEPYPVSTKKIVPNDYFIILQIRKI